MVDKCHKEPVIQKFNIDLVCISISFGSTVRISDYGWPAHTVKSIIIYIYFNSRYDNIQLVIAVIHDEEHAVIIGKVTGAIVVPTVGSEGVVLSLGQEAV